MADDLPKLFLGETLNGQYSVDTFIASGGFCLVFQGVDLATQDPVAIKVLKPGVGTDDTVEFETEGQLLRTLRRRSHVINLIGPAKNVAEITVHKNNIPLKLPVSYLILELADAALSDLVANLGAITWSDRLQLLRDVALGVHQMHLTSIVHRDLKSDNILVMQQGASIRATIADLGRGRDLTQPARFATDAYLAGRGDLRFAPPEMLHLTGTDDDAMHRRADIFLLGSIFFELCTGLGITSVAYRNPRAVIRSALGLDPARRGMDFTARVAQHRAMFEPAFLLAENSMPTHLKHEGGRLLRQLCDPHPASREQRTRVERRQSTWGLEWILRRIDILIQIDRYSTTVRRRSSRKAV